MEQENKIKAYKGFKSDLTCRKFQFEVGKEYEQKGKIEACENGFHACDNLEDVLQYYLIDRDGCLARYCEVELSKEICYGVQQVVSSKIHIKREIPFNTIIKHIIKDIVEDRDNMETYWRYASKKHSDQININREGYAVFSEGSFSEIRTLANHFQILSIGPYSKIETSGCKNTVVSTGKNSQVIVGGVSSSILSTGNYTRIHATSSSSSISALGEYSLVVSYGYDTKVKAGLHSYITLAEHNEVGHLISVKTCLVDGRRIKANTWYKLSKGKFVTVV